MNVSIRATLAAALLAACSGSVDGEGVTAPQRPATGPNSPPGQPTPGAPPVGMTPATNPNLPSSPPGTPGAPATPELPRPPGDLPALGNEADPTMLDPAKLFTCASGRSVSPARLWRLNEAQYSQSVQALGLKGFANPFAGVKSEERFRNYASSFGMDPVTLGQLIDGTELIADRLLASLKRTAPCLAATTIDARCVREQMGKLAQTAFRGPVPAEVLDTFVAPVLEQQAALGSTTALRLGVEAILISPRFLFRTEIGTEPPDASGRRRLGAYEIASALSFGITDAPPDKALLDAAAANALSTPEQIRPHVARLLESELDNPLNQNSSEPRSMFHRFFREYLQYDQVLEVFKDPKDFGFHKPPFLIRDTDLLMVALVSDRRDFVRAMLTSNDAVMMDPYGFTRDNYPVTGGGSGARISLPASQGRSGILTQPSFLAGFSHADANDPIRRGKFVRQSLLCQAVPALPVDEIPALPELGPNATLREQLAQHAKDPRCAGCHTLMDPIGFGLEGFDHVGRVRTTEGGRPVDARGTLTGAGAQDGPFNGARELGQKLASSPVVTQCFTRHAFRFLLGRNETMADACTLAAALDAYQKSGGDVLALFTSILTSESFLYRN